ncbi:MAG: hypothetical protein KDK90_26885 [Leptospiraceae bacterium]|nr:hypothetical protein [Leptospiraceae bacterium]
MITWEYRVFLEEDGDYIIREVFYDDDGNLSGCTKNAVEPFGRSLKDLAEQIEFFKRALTLPVLKISDIPLKQVEKSYEKKNCNINQKQILSELSLT